MIDIIIISYNTQTLTLECIDSIYKNTIIPFNIYVVDNASSDKSVELIKNTFPSVNIIQNTKNEGYGRACNKGIKASTNPYIVFLNSDIKVTRGWETAMVNTFEQNDKVGVVGSKLIDGNNHIMGCGVIGTNVDPKIRYWMEVDNGQADKQIDCISVCGACMMIKRENIPILGVFDEQYFFYYEETDYCYNARYKNYRIVYCPTSRVIHHQHGSCSDQGLLRKYFDESDKIFKQKWQCVMEDKKVYG